MLGRRFEMAGVAVALAALALAAAIGLADGWDRVLDALVWIAALTTVPTLGLAGFAHVAAMRRMQRVKAHDALIAATGVAATAIVAVALALAPAQPRLATALLHCCWPAWVLGLAFTAYLLHAAASRPLEPGMTPRTIVVLGGALQGRHVGPLLRRRVERAATLWHDLGDPSVRMVASGGQGADEPRSEAAAMAEHLVEACGVPASAIDLEDRSTSTEENLALTRGTLGATEPWLVVTSEYHVPRTRVLLQRLGIRGDATGSWSSPVYRPGALVRELAATVRPARATFLVLGALAVASTIVGLVRTSALVG
ncbi:MULTISPECIES: YdcF family protein [unclassified Agrococcus]|uniref:YdcF family protein n=1 Tax=unclassified Agrococcus TaxID=2615065 RepID=UPI0036127D35